MKKEVPAKQVIEVPDEGLIKLLGKQVALMCLNYTYAGKLVGVNDSCVQLESGGIVFETGPFSEEGWKDFQKLPSEHVYVQTRMIEAFYEAA